jgi:Right handed beta helix region
MYRRFSISVTAAALAVAAGGVIVATAHAASIPGNVFVSPAGNDSNPGTQSAPVKTVQRAQQLVRALNDNMSADVTVVLADGFYRLTGPLTLSSADSGTGGHNVVWTADNGARPVFAGSAQITGWTRMSANSPVFVAQAPAGLSTRQLYVNGTRAARAHGALPSPLTGRNSTGYSGGGGTMAGWRNPSGAKPQLEFVYRGGLGAWTEPRCPVASISSGGAVTMAQPCWTNSTTRACCFADGRAYNLVGRQSITEQPTSVENAFQFLSASTPGQWFLDQGNSKLYYVPRSGENMATADVEAPVLQKLVDGSGVSHVVFNGIQFSYATWLGPNSGDGFSEIQANYQVTGPNGAARQALCDVAPAAQHGTCPYAAWTQAPANVSLTNDQNVQFTNDAFVHLGAAGLGLGDGTQNATVKGNVFTDISGSGIQLGNVDMPTATGASQTTHNTITDNHVFNVPVEYHGGIGIDIGYAANTKVTHNQIDHTPYTAISIGWGGWPDKEKQKPRPNFTHDNSISNNLIFNHMSVLNDGGAIYTQGLTGTSLAGGEKVTGNLIHDQTGKGHVVYTDNGCTFETITGNGIYNTGAANAWGSTHHNYAPGATTTNDPTDVENNWWENGATSGSSGVTVKGNHAITSGSQVPASIVDNAGLEAAFKGLLNWKQAPLPPVH